MALWEVPSNDLDELSLPCILVLVWDNHFNKGGLECGRPTLPRSCKTVRKRGSPHPSRIEPEQLPGPTKPASCKDGPVIRRRCSWIRKGST